MKTLSTLLWLLLLSAYGYASHILGSTIQARRLSPTAPTYEFTVTMFLNAKEGRTATEQMNDVLFCFGDGSPARPVPRVELKYGELDPNLAIAKFRTTYTYTGGGIRTVSVFLTSRSDNIRNLPQAVNQSYFTEMPLDLDVQNNTPVFATPERIFTGSTFQPVTFSLRATDAEGDSIRYIISRVRMGECNRNSQLMVGHVFPNEVSRRGIFAINARTGLLTWNAPTEVGLYEFLVLAEEWRNGRRISQVPFSMVIRVEDRGGTPSPIPPFEPVLIDGNFIVTGVHETTGVSLKAYPIPSPDRFQITLTNPQPAPALFQLFDVQGRMIREISLPTASDQHELTIDAQQWAPGTYVLRVRTAGHTLSTKLLKK